MNRPQKLAAARWALEEVERQLRKTPIQQLADDNPDPEWIWESPEEVGVHAHAVLISSSETQIVFETYAATKGLRPASELGSVVIEVPGR